MSERKVYRAIGLMSGTSLDGIDCALIETDGQGHVKPLGFVTQPYDDALRTRLRSCFGKTECDDDIIRDMTLAHADIVKQSGFEADVIGFHGQTTYHAPDDGITLQIGDGALLAEETGIDVVYDMRSADVAASGQGAPLLPLYHQALAKAANLDLPIVVLNIGGVGNVTYIDENEILAFDTGPGNALMDDYIQKTTGAMFDENGEFAAQGTANNDVLKEWLSHDYFSIKPPKSLDRDEWDIAAFGNVQNDDLSQHDFMATLLQFSAQSILKSREHMPKPPKQWYACGGGRHNMALMGVLAEYIDLKNMDSLGWDGDATEAEGFAYLAVRSLLNLPLSLPTTTGVKQPQKGGVFVSAKAL